MKHRLKDFVAELQKVLEADPGATVSGVVNYEASKPGLFADRDQLVREGDRLIATSSVKPGLRYRHYKGEEVEVLHVGFLESNLDPVVCYRCLDSGRVWVRTLASWWPLTDDEGVNRGIRFIEITEAKP